MSETRTIHRIRLEDVYPSPKQYRRLDKEHVQRLADSMESIGQQQPIDVMADGDIYYVEAGNHRVEALKSIGAEFVDAYITNGDPEAAAARMVADNIARPDDAVEKARGTQLMLATGVRPEVVAKQIGVSVEQAQAASRAIKLVDPIAVEEHTFDWLLAIDEYRGNPGAVAALKRAPEGAWQRLKRDYDERAGQKRSVEHAVAMLTEAAVPHSILKDPSDKFLAPDGIEMQFIGYEVVRESTTDITLTDVVYATVAPAYWGSRAQVGLYVDPKSRRATSQTAEAIKRDEDDRLRREMSNEVAEARWEHMARSIDLEPLAEELWSSNFMFLLRSTDYEEDRNILFPDRLVAQILRGANGLLRQYMGNGADRVREGYKDKIPGIIAIFDALEVDGYELTTFEREFYEALAGTEADDE